MTRLRMLITAGSLLFSSAALAEDYKCVSGERIEKGSSTWGKAVSANGDWRIETSGGSTIGWLKGNHIESAGGSTRASLSDAKSLAACSDAVAAALWVLEHEGRL